MWLRLPGTRGGKILLALLLLLLLWVVFMPGRGLLAYLRLQRELARTEQKNLELTRQNSGLREEIDSLRGDDTALEQVARSRHGLLKTNEIVYEISPTATREHKTLPLPQLEVEGEQPGELSPSGAARQ